MKLFIPARSCAFMPCLTVCSFICTSIAFAADTGDAPGSYGVVTHEIVVPSPFLGDVVADDNINVADSSAMGDDDDGLDDEGGVFAFPVLVQNLKSYDTNVFASNPLDVSATVSGWVDFDGNGKFDTDEYATAVVPPGTQNQKYKLVWPNLRGVTTDFAGITYARFRISSAPLLSSDGAGAAPDGEVEDYALEVLLDSDSDEIPDSQDVDNDNDGIPNILEGIDVDTDNDGIVNALDADSDADLIPDFVEAGENPLEPVDSDSDGTPDYLDLDSNGDGVLDIDERSEDIDGDGLSDAEEGTNDSDADGIVNARDLDSDNDTIPDAIERGAGDEPVDTDQDGIADYLDLDSDNDGVIDIREANSRELNVNLIDIDNDGRVDSAQLTGINGYLDLAETAPDSGIPIFAVADSDSDGTRDFRDLDSDNDAVSDLLETLGTDADGNGVVDSIQDENQDGIVDDGNITQILGSIPDTDGDFLLDFQDADADGRSPPQTDSGSDPDGSDDNPANDSARVATGLSGGAGCSVVGGRGSLLMNKTIDIVFPGLLLAGLAVWAVGRIRRLLIRLG
ncbi:MAG: GEVED domain-containing protein [Granulosicoccus sp.]